MPPRDNAAVAAGKNYRPAIRFCSVRSPSLPQSKFLRGDKAVVAAVSAAISCSGVFAGKKSGGWIQCSSLVSSLEDHIGYKFRNSLLLAEALTHPSLGHETQQHHFDNQRLEFLGDAILQVVITEHLFRHFGDEAEGQL